jgi:hypothetical protein
MRVQFFCDTVECVRKVFAERLPQLVAPWAQMTTRLNQALQTIGLATCGRLGARLAAHLGITTSWMTIVRRVMALPTPPVDHVECLGLDDFAFRRGRTDRAQSLWTWTRIRSSTCCRTGRPKPLPPGWESIQRSRM